MARKLKCDLCGKLHATLGGYEDDGGSHDGSWWVCLKCFAKADKLAAKDDRWPDARDFRMISDRKKIPQPG